MLCKTGKNRIFHTFAFSLRIFAPKCNPDEGARSLDHPVSFFLDPLGHESAKSRCIRLETDLGIGWSCGGEGETLVIDGDAHGPRGAKPGLEDGGGGERVVEDGRGRVVPRMGGPLRIEQSELIGERIGGGEELEARGERERYLRGVEREEKDGHTCGKDLLRSWRVLKDVPFRAGRRRFAARRVVAAPDGATHHDDSFQLVEGFRAALAGCGNVEQRSDGKERNLARMGLNGGEQGSDRIGVWPRRKSLGVGTLGEHIGGLGGQPGSDRNGRRARSGEEAIKKTIHQARACFGIAKGGRDAQNPDLGAFEQQRESKGIVDVVADVGVDPDKLRGTLESGWLTFLQGLRRGGMDGDYHNANSHQGCNPAKSLRGASHVSSQGIPPDAVHDRACYRISSGAKFAPPRIAILPR
uniref:Uncharacterized protein n=1 Tax=mine drainage metagenome TaxID=410659 RepID=E6PYA2_9ZZZZ